MNPQLMLVFLVTFYKSEEKQISEDSISSVLSEINNYETKRRIASCDLMYTLNTQFFFSL